MSADVNFCKLEDCSFNYVRWMGMGDQSAWLIRRQASGKKIKSRARVVQRYNTMLAHK